VFGCSYRRCLRLCWFTSVSRCLHGTAWRDDGKTSLKRFISFGNQIGYYRSFVPYISSM
jgi:hypothetical protein